MSSAAETLRWSTDGKFFRLGRERTHLRAVTYGPFPGGWAENFGPDFGKMREVGLRAVRLYELPDARLLDAAAAHGLAVFAGLHWGQNADFFRQPMLYSAAQVRLVEFLKELGHHPALAGVYVGNEVPADLVRWMGPVRVREALEGLIRLGKKISPALLFAYANYPSTEYLEPENADFTAMNVYLEEPEAFRKYLIRLHHLAGDRPVVISEFGLDSLRNGVEKQAAVLGWAQRLALEEEATGFTIFSWSDRWWNNDEEVLDWNFGLMDRAGRDKPAMRIDGLPAEFAEEIDFSVIVCTRNGRQRIAACLEAIQRMNRAYQNYETIVVDDGSVDGTADHVAAQFPWVRLLRLKASGLSAARNAGMAMARGTVLAFTDDDCEPDEEWLRRLVRIFAKGYAAAGGPNLPPVPESWEGAVVCAAPGAPSHVMLGDEEAEHLPGCNLVVTKAACEAIGGFDPQFHTAGDDVDFCWRLRAAGYRLGFAPGAFVWHWRRPSVRAFLRQQIGYGNAERLLIRKYPQRFSKRGGAIWEGFIYGGGAVRAVDGSVIYHGEMGQAGYQSVTNRMLPLRGLGERYDRWWTRLVLAAVRFFQPRVRAWARAGKMIYFGESRRSPADVRGDEFSIGSHRTPGRQDFLELLLANGWSPCGPTDDWDAEKDGTRVLLAMEHGAGMHKRTLVRVDGDLAAVEQLLRTVPGTFK